MYLRSSCTHAKVLGVPTTNFPTWGSSKGTESPVYLALKVSKQDLITGLVHTRTHEKRTVDLQRVSQSLPSRWLEISGRSVCIKLVTCRGQRPEGNSPGSMACWYKSFWRSPLSVSTTITIWPQVKLKGGNTVPPIYPENWIKDLLIMALPTRARPSFSYR